MSFFNWLSKNKDHVKQNDSHAIESEKQISNHSYPVPVTNEIWEELPQFIEADDKDYTIVSLIASSIAAQDYPESSFVIKKILKRNPEVSLVSVIATSILAGDAESDSVVVKKIVRKVEMEDSHVKKV